MTLQYYFKDGDEELKGPFEEDVVLDRYRKAEFTSDVEFQIRSKDSDDAPFITLLNLIKKNGHQNPFKSTNEDLHKKVEERMKELEELSTILAKKPMLEKRLAELEKKIEGRMKQRGTEKKKQPEASTVNDGGMAARRQKHVEADAKITLPPCDDCQLVFSSHKQLLLHTARSSCTSKDNADFAPDFERWKKEEQQRLAAGQRIYKKMSSNEVGSSRPQIDFVEELHSRINKKMVFEYDGEGKDIARTWIKSEEAKKVSDRFLKHLKEASGVLVCTRCQVACRSHEHFIIHLITYDHRLKVKGSPIELLSLLVGNFHKERYLDLPHPSELDEDLELGASASTKPVSQAAATASQPTLPEKSEEYDEEKNAVLKQQYIMDFSDKTLICKYCDVICSSLKQWIIHLTTEEHEDKSGSAGKEASALRETMFSVELQRWRWEDRAKLSTGKRLFESMSENERKEARPTEAFTKELSKTLEDKREEIEWAVRAHGQSFDVNEMRCFYANYLGEQEEGKAFMKSLDDHLNKAIVKRFVCRPCKVAFDSTEKYYVHCQMSKHLMTTVTLPEKLITTLISMQKQDLYFK